MKKALLGFIIVLSGQTVAAQTVLKPIKMEVSDPIDLVVDSEGKYAVVISKSGEIQLIDLTTMAILKKEKIDIESSNKLVLDISLSGRLLAVGGEKISNIYLYDLPDLTIKAVIPVAYDVQSIAIGNGDDFLYTAGEVLNKYDLSGKKIKQVKVGSLVKAQAVACHPKNDNLLGIGYGNAGYTCSTSDFSTGDIVFEVNDAVKITEISFSPSGRYLIAGGSSADFGSNVSCFDIETDRYAKAMAGFGPQNTPLCISVDEGQNKFVISNNVSGMNIKSLKFQEVGSGRYALPSVADFINKGNVTLAHIIPSSKDMIIIIQQAGNDVKCARLTNWGDITLESFMFSFGQIVPSK